MFDAFKQRRAAKLRKEAAVLRMRAEHAAAILRWLTKQPGAADDERLTALVKAAEEKLTGDASCEDARDALYLTAGYARGTGNAMWAAAAQDAVNVLEDGSDLERRRRYEPDGSSKSLRAIDAFLSPGHPWVQEPVLSRDVPARKAAIPRPKPAPRPTRVYVLRSSASKLVKIGVAVNPEQRARDLQTGSPGVLTVAWSCSGREALERELHRRFAPHRKQGEWFDLTPLGTPVDVVRAEVELIRQKANDKGLTAHYFYEEQK